MKLRYLPLMMLALAVLSLFLVSGGYAQNAPLNAAIPEPVNPKPAPESKWPPHLRLLTGPNGGQWFMLGDPIAEVLTKYVIPTTSRLGGGVSNIANVNAKLGDIGFTLTCFLAAAQSKEEEYKDIETDNMTLMVNVYPQVLYFLMRKDFAEQHGIDSVDTLLKKKMPLRFASLKPGTASELIINLLLRYGYHTSFEKLSAENGWSLYFNNYAETADNFVAGELDCFAYTAGTVVPLILTIEEHTDIVILPIKQSVLDLLANKFQTHTYTIEPGTYQGVTKPIKTLGDFTCLVVRKDFPEDLVFAINKTLWENKDAIADIVEDFSALSPLTALPSGLPAHPGSIAYWNSLLKK